MKITCQHCGSDDVVAIQGQEFCISCGNEVAVAQTKPSPPKKAVKQPVAVSSQPVITKFGPSEPVSAPVAQAAEPKKTIKKTRPPKVIDVAVTRTPAVKATESDKPIVARADEKKQRPIHDIQAQPIDTKPHPARFTLKLALAMGIPAGATLAALLWFGADDDVTVLALVSILLIVPIVATLAQTALLYGMARSRDGRPVARSQWWQAARSGFMDVVNVNLVTVVAILLLVASMVGLQRGVAVLTSSMPEGVEPALLIAANAGLVWAMLGFLAARRMAIAAIVIGGLNAQSGLKIGWKAYRQAGGHMALALGETLIGRVALALVVVVVAYAASVYLPTLQLPDPNQVTALVVGLSTAAAIAGAFVVILELEVKVWLRQYRHWVSLYFHESSLRLLSGRMSAPRR